MGLRARWTYILPSQPYYLLRVVTIRRFSPRAYTAQYPAAPAPVDPTDSRGSWRLECPCRTRRLQTHRRLGRACLARRPSAILCPRAAHGAATLGLRRPVKSRGRSGWRSRAGRGRRARCCRRIPSAGSRVGWRVGRGGRGVWRRTARELRRSGTIRGLVRRRWRCCSGCSSIRALRGRGLPRRNPW